MSTQNFLKKGFDFIVTPTYNLSDYGKDLFIPLSSAVGANTRTIDNSAATILRTTFTAPGSVTGEEIDDYPTVIANENTLTMWHDGNDASYDRVFRYNPDAQARLSKLYMNIAFSVVMSVFSSGTLAFNSVSVVVTERSNDSGANDKIVYENTFATGHGTIAAINVPDIFILSAVFGDIDLEKNVPLDFRFTINVTEASKDYTYQTGIVPFFAYNAVSNTKPYSLSGIGMHLNTDLNNAQAVLRKAGKGTKGYFLNTFGEPTNPNV